MKLTDKPMSIIDNHQLSSSSLILLRLKQRQIIDSQCLGGKEEKKKHFHAQVECRGFP